MKDKKIIRVFGKKLEKRGYLDVFIYKTEGSFSDDLCELYCVCGYDPFFKNFGICYMTLFEMRDYK